MNDEDPLDARIGQIFNDFLDRKARGEAVSEADLLAKHPEFAEELGGYFDLVQDLRPGEESVDRLIEQGILKRPSDARYLAELGPYKITGLLGRGGMGIVLKAHEQSLDRTVALKILRPELADDSTALGRFTREAKAAAALRHPNIVTVHAVGEERGTYFIVMEYVAGPTLADLIRERGALPTELIRSVFSQILKGLSAAHEAGLIHRDIKPSNILLDHLPADAFRGVGCPSSSEVEARLHSDDFGLHLLRDCLVKIADFGLARMASAQTSLTRPDSVFGTPEYMSPEQARGDEDIGHRTDLYSAGVVLYEMLTGRPPFKAERPSVVIHQILHDEPPDPRTVSDTSDPHLATLALRLMAKRPEERPANAAASVALLGTSKRVRSRRQRPRLRPSLTIIAVIVALLGWAAWVAIPIASRSAKLAATTLLIKDVAVAPRRPSVIQAWYGGDPDPHVFYDEFPPEVEQVTVAELVDANGDDTWDYVVACVDPPLHGNCLFVLDASTKEIRLRLNLSGPKGWPDCAQSDERAWGCSDIVVGNLDGKPGDEILVTAQHASEYPSRLSMLNPRTNRVGPTFWHMGHISTVLIYDDFFGESRPAVVLRAMNNKLDGFNDSPRPGEAHYTDWDRVWVVAILDPFDMQGLGPPQESRVAGIPPVVPYAYAFLDLPYNSDVQRFSYMGTDRMRRELTLPTDRPLDEFGGVTAVKGLLSPAESAPILIEAVIAAVGQGGEERERGSLLLDGNLSIREFVPNTTNGLSSGVTTEYWKQYWRPVVQAGRYLTDQVETDLTDTSR